MNRDEVIFYFLSLRLAFVFITVVQAAIAGVLVYFYFQAGSNTMLVDLGVDSQTMMFFLVLPLLALSGGSMFFRKQIAKAVKVWGVDKKMAIYRKALLLNWILCALAAGMVGFIFYSTQLVWVPVFTLLIFVYFITTYITPIKLAKQLQLTRGEVNELQAFYKDV
jgi:hypothetical protein